MKQQGKAVDDRRGGLVAQGLLLVAHGADRPGILDEISQYLYERGGNISDSKLLSLRGSFILMILLYADTNAAARIREGLAQLAQGSRIGVDVRDAGPEEPTGTSASSASTYRFAASGSDQAGLLHKLSHLLRALNVNIIDVRSHVTTPVRGESEEAKFTLELMLSVPRDTPVIKVREYVGTVCAETGIEWELAPG